MILEEECKPQDKYLFTDERWSDESMIIWQKKCVESFVDKEKSKEYEKFINWKCRSNEIALFLYTYADFEIPKQFDCIFELKNPSNFIVTKFNLTQSIIEGFYPSDSIQHGYKHLCIFEFEEEIPAILDKLHIVKNEFSFFPKGVLTLGICQVKDFEEIKTARELINSRGF